MKSNRFNLIKNQLLLIFVAITICCFCNSVTAQSGRRLPKLTPTPVVTETKTPPSEKNILAEKIEYLIIVGEVQNDDSNSDTVLLGSTLNYCLRQLELQPNLKIKANVGGKMDFKEAQDKAKKEKNVHILWIGFTLENLGKGKTQVKYANFTILNPESAEKLFIGRVDSKMLSENGGVSKIKKPIDEAAKIHNIGEEIINRLLCWGWLSN